MAGDGKHPGRERSANDNRPPGGQAVGNEGDVSERLDRVVLTIARLIVRQIAREHFEALQAANNSTPPNTDSTDGGDDGK